MRELYCTRPWGRVQRGRAGEIAVPRVQVSILTRPWGRVQRSRRTGRFARTCGFNPHPPVGAGATYLRQPYTACDMPFQSSPAREGGCNEFRNAVCESGFVVSILTRPWGRVQRRALVHGVVPVKVSILTRPWGRVQRTNAAQCPNPPACFNPHPPVGAGATLELLKSLPSNRLFQSSPARGGGCNSATGS